MRVIYKRFKRKKIRAFEKIVVLSPHGTSVKHDLQHNYLRSWNCFIADFKMTQILQHFQCRIQGSGRICDLNICHLNEKCDDLVMMIYS